MNSFCIVANDQKESAVDLAGKIKAYIENNGGACIICKNNHAGDNFTRVEDVPEQVQCVLVIGGDGTFLQAARDLSSLNLPMVGINLGSLGFLTMTEASDVYKAVDSLLKDEYSIDYRMMLDISAEGKNSETALNDVVISRGGYSHLIGITVYVNDKVFGSYEGDGLIVSTPTGSTGYNLSTGGPVVTPNVDAMLITPICPHAISARSFIVSAGDVVRVEIGGIRHDYSEEAYVTIDGAPYGKFKQGQEIIIKKADKQCKMCLTEDVSFIDTLNTKLVN